uniref:Transcriptional regulator n=1 Tax=Heterorhabditis bacteriophora TaxID=37862 RepID=A0A1I7WTH5_HETBA
MFEIISIVILDIAKIRDNSVSEKTRKLGNSTF